MNKRRVGTSYEAMAGEYLTARGMRVLTYNFRTRYGEIDIIGYDTDTLVFVEVKYRKTNKMGYAAEAVDTKKMYRICRVSDVYMLNGGITPDTQIRYDVVAIDGDEINWIKNAYDYIPR